MEGKETQREEVASECRRFSAEGLLREKRPAHQVPKLAAPHPAPLCPAASLFSGSGGAGGVQRAGGDEGQLIYSTPTPVPLWPLFLSRHLSSTATALQGPQRHCSILSGPANGLSLLLVPGLHCPSSVPSACPHLGSLSLRYSLQ